MNQYNSAGLFFITVPARLVNPVCAVEPTRFMQQNYADWTIVYNVYIHKIENFLMQYFIGIKLNHPLRPFFDIL